MQLVRYINEQQILEPLCITTPAVNQIIRQPVQDDQEFSCRVKKISLSLCVYVYVCLPNCANLIKFVYQLLELLSYSGRHMGKRWKCAQGPSCQRGNSVCHL